MDGNSSTSIGNMSHSSRPEKSRMKEILNNEVHPSDALVANSDHIKKFLNSSAEDMPNIIQLSSLETLEGNSAFDKELPNYYANLENNITVVSDSSEFTIYCISSCCKSHEKRSFRVDSNPKTQQ